MDRNLVLIASYPKSGSTWLRYVFEVLRRGGDSAVSIDDIESGYYGGWRRLLFDDIAPANAADLLAGEIDDELTDIYRHLSAESTGPLLIKVHDAAFRTRSGNWLYPPECIRAVIYLVRHPFDVAVSYAHHLGVRVEHAVQIMECDDILAPCGAKLRMPLHERVDSWSGNVASWLDHAPCKPTLARYEDLHNCPVEGFERLAVAAGFAVETESIVRAVEAAQFERLQNEERARGFRERPRSSPAFFRVGRPGSWREEMDAVLRDRIVREHGVTMARLGYTPDGVVLA